MAHSHAPHHAAHEHTPDIDFGAHAADLERTARLWSPVTAQVAAELPLPAGGLAADVGCGAGELALRLAPRAATVYAVDRAQALLDLVARRADAAGVAGAVQPVLAGMEQLPDALPQPVHLVWAGHVVHHAGDQAAALRNLAGALLPGGTLAVAEGGQPPRSLPWDLGIGRPGLEVRLHAALDGWFGSMRAGLPGSVREPRGWPALLREAGLVDVTSRAWVLHVPAPLAGAELECVLHGVASRVERCEPWLDPDDLASWHRLLDQDGPDWLGRRDDVELTAVELVHLGRRPV